VVTARLIKLDSGVDSRLLFELASEPFIMTRERAS